jgi:hypothetical protein
MKRKLKWMAVVLAVLVMGLGAALFLLPRDRITRESWERIRLGMTEKEVEAILGEPGKNMKDFFEGIIIEGKIPYKVKGNPFQEGESSVYGKIWLGRRGIMAIDFDLDWQVTRKTFREAHSADPTLIDNLRDWLGW